MKGGLGYLGLAYIVIWTAIGSYLMLLGRRQRMIDRRLKELRTPDAGSSE